MNAIARILRARLKWTAREMRTWGPLGVPLFAISIVIFMYFTLNIAAPAVHIDTQPLTNQSSSGAFTPGSKFNVAKWCKEQAEHVKAVVAPDASGIKFVAYRGGETVEWVTNKLAADGRVIDNTTGDGRHYWTDAQGQPQGEDVLITGDAIKCMSTER